MCTPDVKETCAFDNLPQLEFYVDLYYPVEIAVLLQEKNKLEYALKMYPFYSTILSLLFFKCKPYSKGFSKCPTNLKVT